jgi:hypothetical protein
MLQSGQYQGLLVSLVGRYESLNMNGAILPFKAADDTLVNLNVKEVEPELLPVSAGPTSPAVEIVGLVESNTQVLVSGFSRLVNDAGHFSPFFLDFIFTWIDVCRPGVVGGHGSAYL